MKVIHTARHDFGADVGDYVTLFAWRSPSCVFWDLYEIVAVCEGAPMFALKGSATGEFTFELARAGRVAFGYWDQEDTCEFSVEHCLGGAEGLDKFMSAFKRVYALCKATK